MVNKLKYVVLGGAGHIGSEITKQIVELDDKAELLIADINFEAARDLADELGDKVSAIEVDALNKEKLISTMKYGDIVISALGPFYKFGKYVVECAIEAGVNFIDIDDDYDATIKCLELNDDARKNGVTAIIGLGASPGLTNMLAKYGAEKLDTIDEIHTSWVWTSIDPTEGPAIVAHYFHACTGEVPTYRDGKLVYVPALSEPKKVYFPPIGSFEVYNVGHPEPITIPRYIKGLKTVTNKGGIWPRYMAEASKLFKDLGITSMKEIEIRGLKTPVRDIAVRIVLSLPEIAPEETITKIIEEAQKEAGDYAFSGAAICVEIIGKKGGRDVKLTYCTSHTSAAFLTAYPTAIGAILLSKLKKIEPGVYAPEGVFNANEFIDAMRKKLRIIEKEVITTYL